MNGKLTLREILQCGFTRQKICTTSHLDKILQPMHAHSDRQRRESKRTQGRPLTGIGETAALSKQRVNVVVQLVEAGIIHPTTLNKFKLSRNISRQAYETKDTINRLATSDKNVFRLHRLHKKRPIAAATPQYPVQRDKPKLASTASRTTAGSGEGD